MTGGFAVILPAAGASNRFGGPTSKLLATLRGIPVLQRTMQTFLARADVASLVIPTSLPLAEIFADSSSMSILLSDRRVKCCAGGESRAHSVHAGLLAASADLEWVAIHDAARPLVSNALIDRVLDGAARYGAAVPALPVSLTIKQAEGPLPAKVLRTIPRHTLWSMQTPQVMRRADLIAAFDRCPISLDQVTDDVQLLEMSGRDVWLVAGEECNLKITTPIDMRIAAALLDEFEHPD